MRKIDGFERFVAAFQDGVDGMFPAGFGQRLESWGDLWQKWFDSFAEIILLPLLMLYIAYYCCVRPIVSGGRALLQQLGRRSLFENTALALLFAVAVTQGSGLRSGDKNIQSPPKPPSSGQGGGGQGGGNNINSAPGGGSGFARVFTPAQHKASFALAGVSTNPALSITPPPNAVVHEPWLRRGFAEKLFWLPAAANGGDWEFILGTNKVAGLYAASSGTLSFIRPKGSPRARPMPDDFRFPEGDALSFLAPLQTDIGVIPPGGFFWHAPTSSNTLLLTWQDVFAARDTNHPIRVQTELFPNGDFIYRYDLSRFPPGAAFPSTNFVIGAQYRGGGETYAFGAADTNKLVHGLELRWKAFGLYNLDPSSDDQDGDGLSDYDEIMIYGTNPLKWDTDGDGLSDYEEVIIYGTDPLNPDTDGDGLPDGIDPNPLVWDDIYADNDGDGYPLWLELLHGTSDDDPDDIHTLANGGGARLVTFTASGAPAPNTIFSIGGKAVFLAPHPVFSLFLSAGQSHALRLANAPAGVAVTISSPGCLALLDN